MGVLNLIITGIPSIRYNLFKVATQVNKVLNLIITGIPSILSNIKNACISVCQEVLNLIITGIPSILNSCFFDTN